MQKVEKCTDCGATRVIKNDLCKRCRMNGFHEIVEITDKREIR